jgi:hypothetical protein
MEGTLHQGGGAFELFLCRRREAFAKLSVVNGQWN